MKRVLSSRVLASSAGRQVSGLRAETTTAREAERQPTFVGLLELRLGGELRHGVGDLEFDVHWGWMAVVKAGEERVASRQAGVALLFNPGTDGIDDDDTGEGCGTRKARKQQVARQQGRPGRRVDDKMGKR